MARELRQHDPGAFYHVMARGNYQQEIFSGEEDFRYYLRLLEKYALKYAVTVHAYALMSNHVHLLLQEGDTPLGRFMQGVQQSYTQFVNKQTGRSGHLFQGRYKAIRLDSDEYLLSLVRYIHLNPVSAGLAQMPADYRWSSHRHYYLGDGEGRVETSVIKCLMAEFGNKEIADYQLLMEAQPRPATVSMPPEHVEQNSSPAPRPTLTPLPRILAEVAEFTEIPAEDIVGRSRSRPIVRARRFYIYAAVKEGHSLAALSRYLGRSSSTISEVAQEIEADCAHNGAWKAKLGEYSTRGSNRVKPETEA